MSGLKSLARVALVAVGIFSFMAVGCGGGGGSSSGPGGDATLAGTWKGSMETENGTMVVISVVVDNNNRISSIFSDGNDTGLSGIISKVSGQEYIYSVALSDGRDAGFYVNASMTHAVFLDEDFNFGVVQKGASGLAYYYDNTDIFNADYSGSTVLLDYNFNLTQVMTTTANVSEDGALNGGHNTGDWFTSYYSLNVRDNIYGVWQGAIRDQDGSLSNLRVISSPDKRVFGAYSWPSTGGAFPQDLTFSIMSSN